VCPESRASMEAQMDHESIWNIEPVIQEEVTNQSHPL